MSAELSSFTLWKRCIGSLRTMWHFVSLPNFLEKRNSCVLGILDNCKGRLKAILLNIKLKSVEVIYEKKEISVCCACVTLVFLFCLPLPPPSLLFIFSTLSCQISLYVFLKLYLPVGVFVHVYVHTLPLNRSTRANLVLKTKFYCQVMLCFPVSLGPGYVFSCSEGLYTT